MAKISIIVPLYNEEKHLAHCINSILAQTFSDIELILVDNGSTDSSAQICDEYEKKDSRIKVIHQKNLGVSAARNIGIKNATSKYIGFCDADDALKPQMYEKLYDAIIHADAGICMCDSQAVFPDGRKETETFETLSESCVLKKKQITPEILMEIAGAVWRGLYRADLFRNNNIQFPVDLKISEDRVFNICAIGSSRKIVYLKEAFYLRYIFETSTVHRYHSDYYETAKRGKELTQQALTDFWDDDKTFKDEYLNQFVYAAIFAIGNIKRKESGLNYFRRLIKIRNICSDEELIKAIKITGYADKKVEARWILEKNILALNMRSRKIYFFLHRIKNFLKHIVRKK